VGYLDEDAGAIASFGIATRGATMGEVDEDLEAFANDFVALLTANAGHKSHAASIVLMLGAIESLGLRNATAAIRSFRSLHGNLLNELFALQCVNLIRKDTIPLASHRGIAKVVSLEAFRCRSLCVWGFADIFNINEKCMQGETSLKLEGFPAIAMRGVGARVGH
jgi:hypothetical protein